MKKCLNCKTELQIDHSFCPKCACDLRIKKTEILSDDSKVSEEEADIRKVLELTPPPLPKSDIQPSANLIDNKAQKQGMFDMPFSFDGRIRRTEYGISLIIY